MVKLAGRKMQCVAATLLLAVAGETQAAGQLDQEQASIVPLTEVGGSAIGGDSDQLLAQVVTAGISGDLTSLGLAVACSTTVPNNSLIVEIRGVTTDPDGNVVPDAAIKTTEVIPAMDLPTFTNSAEPEFRVIEFDNKVGLSEGDEFSIVLRSEGQCITAQGPVGDAYTGGDAYFDARPNPPGEWVPISVGTGRRDLPFQAFVAPAIDHFKCYLASARGPGFERQDVFLEDQFGAGGAVALRPVSICNPVDKNGEGIQNPESLLVCYKISSDSSDFTRRQVLVGNQFGEQPLSVRRPDLLCVPSTFTDPERDYGLDSDGSP